MYTEKRYKEKRYKYLRETGVSESIINFLQTYENEINPKTLVWFARELQKELTTESPINRSPSIIDNYKYIDDWFRSIRPNISQYNFNKAFELSENWHNEIAKKEVDKSLIYNKISESDIVYKSEDGYFIVNITNDNDLKVEGEKMGHCVGGYGSKLSNKYKIYSLRDNKGEPHATFEINVIKDIEYLFQLKGKGNKVPISKYQPAIIKWIILQNINVENCIDIICFDRKQKIVNKVEDIIILDNDKYKIITDTWKAEEKEIIFDKNDIITSVNGSYKPKKVQDLKKGDCVLLDREFVFWEEIENN